MCELILPNSISLLLVKLWDLVIKKYMLECLNFSVSKLFYREITEQLTIYFRAE